MQDKDVTEIYVSDGSVKDSKNLLFVYKDGSLGMKWCMGEYVEEQANPTLVKVGRKMFLEYYSLQHVLPDERQKRAKHLPSSSVAYVIPRCLTGQTNNSNHLSTTVSIHYLNIRQVLRLTACVYSVIVMQVLNIRNHQTSDMQQSNRYNPVIQGLSLLVICVAVSVWQTE